MIVSLKEIVDALDLPNQAWVSYLNPKTREIVAVTGEDRRLAERADLDEAGLLEWKHKRLRLAWVVLKSADGLALPDKPAPYRVRSRVRHEDHWRTMTRSAMEVREERDRRLTAGPFRPQGLEPERKAADSTTRSR